MKIGLITVYFADYGSFFQAAALCRQLEAMGHQVELIHESFRYASSPRLLAGSAMSCILPGAVRAPLEKKFSAFRTYRLLKNDVRSLPIAKPHLRRKGRYKAYDCVVVGSDEQWSSTNATIRFVPDVFGIDVPVPHFSYATSGITLVEAALSPHRKRQMIEGWKGFACLSARDDVTKRRVEKWLGDGTVCEKVLDPTLLNPYFARPQAAQPVMVVYGEHFDPKQQAEIQRFAQKNHWSTLAISWPHDWCTDFLQADRAQDVQDAFGSAAYCAVSTFHGTIFSILAHRPFVSMFTPLRGEKVKQLLAELDLSDRLYSEKTGIPIGEIDYPKVEEHLAELRATSLQYLSRALVRCAGKEAPDVM